MKKILPLIVLLLLIPSLLFAAATTIRPQCDGTNSAYCMNPTYGSDTRAAYACLLDPVICVVEDNGTGNNPGDLGDDTRNGVSVKVGSALECLEYEPWDDSLIEGATADSTTANTLTDTGAFSGDDYDNGDTMVEITSGDCDGDQRLITSHTSDTLTVSENFSETCGAPTYEIKDATIGKIILFEVGDNVAFNYDRVLIDEKQPCVSVLGATAPDPGFSFDYTRWIVADTHDVYISHVRINQLGDADNWTSGQHDSGTATSTTSNTLTDTGHFTPGEHVTNPARMLHITSGNCDGDERPISGNTADTITVTWDFSASCGTTPTYEVISSCDALGQPFDIEVSAEETYNIVVANVSMRYGQDINLKVYDASSSAPGISDCTFLYNIIADPLDKESCHGESTDITGHGFGIGTRDYNERLDFYGNIVTNAQQRVPRAQAQQVRVIEHFTSHGLEPPKADYDWGTIETIFYSNVHRDGDSQGVQINSGVTNSNAEIYVSQIISSGCDATYETACTETGSPSELHTSGINFLGTFAYTDLESDSTGFTTSSMNIESWYITPVENLVDSSHSGYLFNKAGAYPAYRDTAKNPNDLDADLIVDWEADSLDYIDGNGGSGVWPAGLIPSLTYAYRSIEDISFPSDPHGDSDADGYTNLEEWNWALEAAMVLNQESANPIPSVGYENNAGGALYEDNAPSAGSAR